MPLRVMLVWVCGWVGQFTEHRKVEEIEGVLLSSRPEKMISPITTHDEAANGQDGLPYGARGGGTESAFGLVWFGLAGAGKLRIFSEMGNHLQLIGLAAFMYFRPGVPMVFMVRDRGPR